MAIGQHDLPKHPRAMYSWAIRQGENTEHVDDLEFLYDGVSKFIIKANGGASPESLPEEALRGQVIFTIDGELAVTAGKLRLYNRLNRFVTIDEVHCSVDTPSEGADIIIDINMDQGSVFTIPGIFTRPTIPAGDHWAVHNGDGNLQVSWGQDSFLTLDIDQVGSVTPGSDLSVVVSYV